MLLDVEFHARDSFVILNVDYSIGFNHELDKQLITLAFPSDTYTGTFVNSKWQCLPKKLAYVLFILKYLKLRWFFVKITIDYFK